MRKSPKKKDEIRYWGFVNAEIMEWQRLIENPELINEIKAIQKSYGLPVFTNGLNHLSAKEVTDWMGWNEPSLKINEETGRPTLSTKALRRQKLSMEEKELAARFDIPAKFYISLHRMIILDEIRPEIVGANFPSFDTHKGKDGKWVEECIITPETDLDNQIVLNMIKHWQSLHRDTIPQPQPSRDNVKRLDWRPVWEWQKRHPDISDKEIAKMLGRNRVTVSRALEKLDKENPLQK